MSAAVYAAAKFEHATKIALITSPPANALYFPHGRGHGETARRPTITGTISAMPGSDLTSAVLKARQNGTQAIAATLTPIVDQVIVAARQNGITLPIVSSLQPAQIKSVGSAGEGVDSIEPYGGGGQRARPSRGKGAQRIRAGDSPDGVHPSGVAGGPYVRRCRGQAFGRQPGERPRGIPKAHEPVCVRT